MFSIKGMKQVKAVRTDHTKCGQLVEGGNVGYLVSRRRDDGALVVHWPHLTPRPGASWCTSPHSPQQVELTGQEG